MKYTRNQFIKAIGFTGLASLTSPGAIASPEKTKPSNTNLTLGLASYTLRKFNLEDVIKISQRLGLNSVAFKNMHLPFESSAEDLKGISEKVKAAGLKLYGAGVIYMRTQQEVENTFTYATNAGLEMIIGVPNHEFLPLCNELVQKHNIKLSIHNHGPGDKLYSSPDDVHEKIKTLDKKIGFCIDIGHVIRIGQDPVKMIEKYKDRLYDLHMKDVDKNTAEGKPLEVGRGIIDIPAVIKTLKKIKYQGNVAFEYEKDADDPVAGLAESVGYVRGVMRVV